MKEKMRERIKAKRRELGGCFGCAFEGAEKQGESGSWVFGECRDRREKIKGLGSSLFFSFLFFRLKIKGLSLIHI